MLQGSRLCIGVLVSAMALASAATATASTGFGTDAKTVVDEMPAALADAALDTSAGTPARIVIAGGSHVARLLPDGTLDQGFGEGGLVDVAPHVDASDPRIHAVAVEPDGDLIVAGAARQKTTPPGIPVRGPSAFRVTLAEVGTVTGAQITRAFAPGDFGSYEIQDLVAPADDSFVEMSYVYAPLIVGTSVFFGSGDTTAGANRISFGPPTAGLPNELAGTALIPTAEMGAYAVGLNIQRSTSANPDCNPSGCGSGFGVTKLLSDATRDAGFSDDGWANFVMPSGVGRPAAAAPRPYGDQGGILLAGYQDGDRTVDDYQTDAVLAQMEPDGTLDEGFGDDGMVVTGTALQPQATAFDSGSGSLVGYTDGGAFRLDRYDANGSVDGGYGTDGSRRIEFDAGPAGLDTLLIDEDVTIAAGSAGGDDARPALVRLGVDGGVATLPEPEPEPDPEPSPEPDPVPGPSTDPSDPGLGFEVLRSRVPQRAGAMLKRGASAKVRCAVDCQVRMRIVARGSAARRMKIDGVVARGKRELWAGEHSHVDAFLKPGPFAKLQGKLAPGKLRFVARFEPKASTRSTRG